MSIRMARHLRSNSTDAEIRLWLRLRRRQLDGYRFRRQVPLGGYVVDFACFERRLIVEVDGGQHSERASQDTQRTVWLEAQGYSMLRFWNNDVLANTAGVLERIREALANAPRPRPSPAKAEEE